VPDTLFASADLIEPGDLVRYHGSLPKYHGLYLATPCDCARCALRDARGLSDARYRLHDPYGEHERAPRCVRRISITPAAGGR
jgi:hypothetical protein